MLASVFGEPALPQDCFAGCDAQHLPAEAGQDKTTRCRVLREHSLPVLPRLRRRWCGLILPLLGSERSATNRWPGESRVQQRFFPR